MKVTADATLGIWISRIIRHSSFVIWNSRRGDRHSLNAHVAESVLLLSSVLTRGEGAPPVGFYSKYILPRIVNRLLSSQDCLEQRERITNGLQGEVLEIGFGSGLNLPYYPSEVTRIHAVDPDLTGRRMAAGRLAECPIPVDFTGLDGQQLPLDSNSMDTVLSTWTLCTIPDLSKALAEIARVLKPGGGLHFLEHGLSPDAKVARWQHRLNPVQRFIGGGCNLNRKIDDLLRSAAFEITDAENFYLPGPRIMAYMYKGVAVSTA